MLLGNKPLPELMLIQICHYMVSVGHNELTPVVFNVNCSSCQVITEANGKDTIH